MGWFKLFWVYMLPGLFHQVSAWDNIWIGRCCLKNIKCLFSSDIWMEWNDFIYSESPCCMMHPNKFLLIRKYGFKEVLKIPRKSLSAQPSFLSKWNERSIYESLFGLKHQIKFLLMRTYGFEEDGVWQISWLLFSSWPSWYLIYSEPPCLPWFLLKRT